MRRLISLLHPICSLLLVAIVLGACSDKLGIGDKPDIIGRWQFTATRWENCSYMEFFESGIADWCNDYTQRLWRMKPGGQLETTPGIWGSARVDVYQVKINDDTMEIIDERGNRAIGTRTR